MGSRPRRPLLRRRARTRSKLPCDQAPDAMAGLRMPHDQRVDATCESHSHVRRIRGVAVTLGGAATGMGGRKRAREAWRATIPSSGDGALAEAKCALLRLFRPRAAHTLRT